MVELVKAAAGLAERGAECSQLAPNLLRIDNQQRSRRNNNRPRVSVEPAKSTHHLLRAVVLLQPSDCIRTWTQTLISPPCARAHLDITRLAHPPLPLDSRRKLDKLDPEKENRIPRSMSAATRDKDARKSVGRNTPGRRGRTGNQYFDVGKVGR